MLLFISGNHLFPQHEYIRDARSHERKIRIELKDFIDRMKKKRGILSANSKIAQH